MPTIYPRRLALLGLLLLCSPLALAHHPMDGMTPETFMQGLLSGLGHPVIGLDHLAFIVGVGLLSLRFPGRAWLPVAFVAGTVLGTGVHLLAPTLPLVEVAIALSVVLLGTLLWVRPDLPPAWLLGGLGLAGLCHGHAYGETVVGAEASPLLAYLLGFALIQTLLALAIREAGARWSLPRHWQRRAGQAVTLAGVASLVALGV